MPQPTLLAIHTIVAVLVELTLDLGSAVLLGVPTLPVQAQRTHRVAHHFGPAGDVESFEHGAGTQPGPERGFPLGVDISVVLIADRSRPF